MGLYFTWKYSKRLDFPLVALLHNSPFKNKSNKSLLLVCRKKVTVTLVVHYLPSSVRFDMVNLLGPHATASDALQLTS